MATDEELYGSDFLISDDGDISFNSKDDFITVSGRSNLRQAVGVRLKTEIGELEQHPLYGTELTSVIGKYNNDLLLSEIRQKVRKALIQEPRIQTILSITAQFAPGTKNRTVLVNMGILPINSTEPLNIIYPIFLTA